MKRLFISLLLVFTVSFGFARTINDFDLALEALLDEIVNDGDVVYLTDGTTVEGVITEQNAETLTLQKASGEMVTIKMSNVLRVESRLNAGDYNYTITAQYGEANLPQVVPPVRVEVANNNSGEVVTMAADFHGNVFPHLTKVKGKIAEPDKSWLVRQDHYVGDGVDFNAVEFEKFIKMYCPESAKHIRKTKVNMCIGSGILILESVFILTGAAASYGIVDGLVAIFFYCCAIHHIGQEFKSYEKIYAGQPFTGNDGSDLLMPVETPVYSITPMTEVAE